MIGTSAITSIPVTGETRGMYGGSTRVTKASAR